MATALSCCKCGYDLSGIPASDVCPECATSLAESRAWITSGGNWLQRMRTGAALLLLGPLLLAAGIVLAAFAHNVPSICLLLLCVGCWTGGWWFVGAKPPDGLLQVEWAGIPAGVRTCVVLEWLLLLMTAPLVFVPSIDNAAEAYIGMLLGAAVLTLVSHWVLGFCLLGHFGAWANDLPLKWGAFAAIVLPLGAAFAAVIVIEVPFLSPAVLTIAALWILAVWARFWWRCDHLLPRI